MARPAAENPQEFFALVRAGQKEAGFVYDLSACQQTMIPIYTLEQIPYWLDILEDIETVATVEFTQFSRRIRESRRYKTNWVVLCNPTPVYQFLKGRVNFMHVLYDYPFVLRYIWPQHHAQQILAVTRNPAAIQFVRPPSNELLAEAVSRNGLILRYGKDPSPDVCLAAVRNAGLAIAYVPENIRTRRVYRARWAEICDAAVAADGLALQFVDPKTPERCRVAVAQNGWALSFCPEKTLELCRLAVQQNPATLWITTPQFRRTLELPPVRIGVDIRRRKLRGIPVRFLMRNARPQGDCPDAERGRPPGDQGLPDILRW